MIFRISALCFFSFVLFSPIVFAQNQKTSEEGTGIPVGMESIQVSGGYRLLVPQGAKIRRVGAQIIVEDDREYNSRRFYEISQSVEDLKTQLKQLQDDVKTLTEEIQSSGQNKTP